VILLYINMDERVGQELVGGGSRLCYCYFYMYTEEGARREPIGVKTVTCEIVCECVTYV